MADIASPLDLARQAVAAAKTAADQGEAILRHTQERYRTLSIDRWQNRSIRNNDEPLDNEMAACWFAQRSASHSPLKPKADECRRCPLWVISGHSITSTRCPLYPQKRTLVEPAVMSSLCQKRTW
jgi:hypothetical protein